MPTAKTIETKYGRGVKPVPPSVPMLLNGDHLSLPEFERRYEATPTVKMAELIEGIVVMAPPASNFHGEAHGTLAFYLKRYAQATPGVSFGLNTSIRLDGKNEFQPDAVLRIDTGATARTKIAPKGFVEGGPEFVAEIAITSAAYDLHEKKAAYQRNGVPEYLVWRVMDSQMQWFALEEGEYVPITPRADGVARSRVFPGLWLNLHALLTGDEVHVQRALERGLQSAEHRAFVKQLRETK